MQFRCHFAIVVIGSAMALSLGTTLKTSTLVGSNDISRWCTVWSLVEQRTYSIDECPWSSRTIDQVYRPEPFQHRPPGQDPVKHFYSSKPPCRQR